MVLCLVMRPKGLIFNKRHSDEVTKCRLVGCIALHVRVTPASERLAVLLSLPIFTI